MTQSKYNGWANYETWNVALWIGNDEGLYREAVRFMRRDGASSRKPYSDFIEYAGMSGEKTADGVKWDGSRLGLRELNTMMRELA